MNVFTKKGYPLFNVVSAMQKAIRRGDAKMAGYWACEMWQSGFHQYFWRRIMIISAEDCAGVITKEIVALWQAFVVLNTYRKGEGGGQLMVCKAAYLLAKAAKSRDVDNLINLVYMDGLGISDEEIKADVEAASEADPRGFPVPEEAWDYHTPRGKKAGETRETFIVREHEKLAPRMPGLFDGLVDKVKANLPQAQQELLARG
jgi:hypothetical protein